MGGGVVGLAQLQTALEGMVEAAAGEQVRVVRVVILHLEDVQERPAPIEVVFYPTLVKHLVKAARALFVPRMPGVAGPRGHVGQHPAEAIRLRPWHTYIDVVIPRNKPPMPLMPQGGAPADAVVQPVSLAELVEGIEQLQAAFFFVMGHLRGVALAKVDSLHCITAWFT